MYETPLPCGNNAAWTFDADTGTLTVTGAGPMYAYGISQFPWDSLKYRIKAVRIDEGMTSVASNAFQSCTNLTDVILPESLEAIESAAFYYCRSLKAIQIPENVSRIGERAFAHCGSLTDIRIDGALTEIGADAFLKSGYAGHPINKNWQDSLLYFGPYLLREFIILDDTECAVREGTNLIAGAAFRNCRQLQKITLPESVNRIGSAAFQCCDRLTEIAIPEGMTEIRKYTFDECRSLASVRIPKSVTHIESCAFDECSSLKAIDYAGDRAGWSAIRIKAGNNALMRAEIRFGA